MTMQVGQPPRREQQAPLASQPALIAAVVAGVLLWTLTTLVTGRREAWDASAYWTVTYPAGILVSAVLGYLAPVSAWRWGAALMLAQAVTMAVLARDFSLLPLGLILFAVLALPPMLAATFGARLARRRGDRVS